MASASETELEAVLDLAEQLLRIQSPTGSERAIADLVAQRIAAQRPHALRRAGDSLCVVPRALDAGKRTVVLLGHLDTVPALDDNPVRRTGDRLYGLGASDMKAACALLLRQLECALRREPRHNLIGVLYAREEGPFARSELPAILAAAQEWIARADLAVCMEPTDNRIELGCLGVANATVTFSGKRAHSARPWQGENALHKAHGLLARLAARSPVPQVRAGLRFVEVVSATQCEVRGARNVVPDRCTLNLNLRFAPGKTEADVRRELDELVKGEASVQIDDFGPAGLVCADNPLLAELRTAAGDPEVCAKQAWTDVGRLSHAGLEAINFGPGATAQAHQAGEWVSIAAVRRALEALQRWLHQDRG